jgi:hypothetical protein
VAYLRYNYRRSSKQVPAVWAFNVRGYKQYPSWSVILKKVIVSVLFMLCAGAQAQTTEPRFAAATAMGEKVGAMPATVDICARHTPQQKAELKQLLTQLENRFASVQGPEFAARYRDGFKKADVTTRANAEQYKKSMAPKDFEATCDKFVVQYPNMLIGLRRLAEHR